MKNSICAIAVTYNRLDMLRQCIAALENQTVSCDILVVDNASTDGTQDWLSTKEKMITIRMLENTGGAGGFNKGMREAVERGYEYIWVMDDDTIPDPDALEKLLDADRILEGNYGWLSSVPLWTDGTGCRMNRQKVDRAYYEGIRLLQYGLLRSSYATFVGLFVKRDVILRVGLPIKEFFIWGDDIEFTRRIAVRMKYPCYIVGQCIVIHAMKDNSGSNIVSDNVERLSRYNYAFRNENYLYRKEGLKGFLYYMAKCGKNILCSLLWAREHRLKRACIVWKQFFAGLLFNPEIEYVTGIAVNRSERV